MKKILLTLALFAPSLISAQIHTKIINGTLDSPRFNPVVKIEIGTESGCTGALITPNVILTAAHCAPVNTGYTISNYRVVVNGRKFRIRKSEVHEGYKKSKETIHDFALLFMTKNADIKPLPLAIQPAFIGQKMQMTGFGLSNTSSFGDLYSGIGYITDLTDMGLFIKYDGIKQTSTTCYGDSGSPAIITVNGVKAIIGVLSSGSSPLCEIGDESYYGKTQGISFVNFIRKFVKKGFKFIK